MKYKAIQEPASNIPDDILEPEIKKMRNGTLSEKMIELLVRQLYKELYNHNLYRTFANFYGTQGFAVLEQYYIDRAEEEKHHHDWVYNYLSECDAQIKYPAVPAIEEDLDDMVKPFEITVDAETKTTEMIYEMVELALEEKDYLTHAWLTSENDDWSRMLVEQIEEMSISRTALDIAKSDGSWVTKEKAIMAAYKGDNDD